MPSLLHTHVRKVGPAVAVVSASGEIDLSTVAKLERALRSACVDVGPSGRVVVECSEVTFLGSVGTEVMLRARESCELLLFAPRRSVLRALRAAGQEDTLIISGHATDTRASLRSTPSSPVHPRHRAGVASA